MEDVHISDDPEADGSRWVIVCTTKFSDIGDGSGQVKPARMVELELATQIFARSKRGNISDVRLQYSTAIIIFSTKFRLCPHHRRIWKLHALTLLWAGKFYLCALGCGVTIIVSYYVGVPYSVLPILHTVRMRVCVCVCVCVHVCVCVMTQKHSPHTRTLHTHTHTHTHVPAARSQPAAVGQQQPLHGAHGRHEVPPHPGSFPTPANLERYSELHVCLPEATSWQNLHLCAPLCHRELRVDSSREWEIVSLVPRPFHCSFVLQTKAGAGRVMPWSICLRSFYVNLQV